MSQKDFILAAHITRGIGDPETRAVVEACFAALFRSAPRFDETRFRAACQPQLEE